MYHHLFIQLPTEGDLGCCQVFTVNNQVAINICVQVLGGYKCSVPLGKYQGEQLLDHMIRICLIL